MTRATSFHKKLFYNYLSNTKICAIHNTTIHSTRLEILKYLSKGVKRVKRVEELYRGLRERKKEREIKKKRKREKQ